MATTKVPKMAVKIPGLETVIDSDYSDDKKLFTLENTEVAEREKTDVGKRRQQEGGKVGKRKKNRVNPCLKDGHG